MKDMPEVVAGLETVSDKIRTLLREGYMRADIARFLGIRYQHVRKVAVDAGIDCGLQVKAVKAPEMRAVSDAPEETPVDLLLRSGFVLLGNWMITDGRLRLTHPAPNEPGVYAFVTHGVVRYIGLTKKGFGRRMYHYANPGNSQRTNQRIKEIITGLVSTDVIVSVYLAMPPALSWNGLPVNTAAGLEAGLIELIQPRWNRMGVA